MSLVCHITCSSFNILCCHVTCYDVLFHLKWCHAIRCIMLLVMWCQPWCHIMCRVMLLVMLCQPWCHITFGIMLLVMWCQPWCHIACDVILLVMWCHIVMSSHLWCHITCYVVLLAVMWCCAPSVRSCYLWWCFTCDVMFYPWHHVTRVGTFLHVTCLTELGVWCHSDMKSFVTYMCHLWCHVSFSFILFVLPWLFWLEKASCLKGKMAMFSCFCWLISLCSPPLTCKSMVACF